MTDTLQLTGLCVLSVLIIVYAFGSLRANASHPRPPGPPPRFLVGNLYDMPTQDLHNGFARLADKYGPVMSLSLPTSRIIVISSAKAASDLLEKRGAIFADRPHFPMMELMGWSWNLSIERYGDSWRAHRRIAQRNLNIVAVKQYTSMLTRLAHEFALELLETPAEFVKLLKRSTAASILEATYGLKIRKNDMFANIAEEAMDTVREVMVPGKYTVDSIPALQYVPSWFPGAQFKRDAARWCVYPERLLKTPFAQTKGDMERGTAGPSMVSSALSGDITAEEERIIMEAAGIMYLDTTIHTMTTFFLEMVRHPEIQNRAQEELLKVVGQDRLPTLEDRESLPYIEAIIREVLRMHPVVPLAIPHRTTEETWYEGMFISKGTVVYANSWAILHDPEIYVDPHVFNPDRFLRDGKIDDTVPHPSMAVFGFGRRICPGMHFADMNIYLMAVTTLACFNIAPVVENGVAIPPKGEFVHGFLSVPLPFRCVITPHSDTVQSLIRNAVETET